MKKLLSILVLSLLFGGNVYAETLEFRDCWVTNSKSLNHNYEKTELSYDDFYFSPEDKINYYYDFYLKN